MSQDRILVLGLGNILYADEGIGVRVAEALHTGYDFPPQVEIVDGGTQGLHLLGLVEQASRLLIIDAVDFGLKPGELVSKRDGHIPAYLSAQKTSVHQNSFSEVLALASLRDALPEEIVLVGMQPADLTLARPLSTQARSALPRLVASALSILAGWGVAPLPASPGKQFHDPSISLERYEARLP